MEYASEGDLHKYLQKNFTSIAWSNRYNQKLHILQEISKGLEYIHKNKFIHRDFHSGNILLDVFQWKIGDLGLSQSESKKVLDIDIKSLSSQNITIQKFSTSLIKRNQEELNLEPQDDSVGKRIKTSLTKL
ncbi:unnamed protein product [Rhizophagus irregularis]|nr:unnamed protein product [Rhizophagus irregularis]